jgi:CRP-like cAMP-binding protein
MIAPTAIRHNKLLAGLPGAEGERLAGRCEMVELGFGDVLAQRGDAMTHAYFPLQSFISLIAQVGDQRIEVGMAGDEGMVGISLGLGIEASSLRAMVQGGGSALRMPARAFQRELAGSAPLRSRMGGYTHVMMSQFAQTAACNRFHVVAQRLARWLLMTADRAHTDSFDITHEFLAAMLGVRRVGVTNAAGELQARELIRYSRGHMRILDRKGLERAACACYRADLASYDRALQ